MSPDVFTTDDYIAELIATAPALTEAQCSRLAALLLEQPEQAA